MRKVPKLKSGSVGIIGERMRNKASQSLSTYRVAAFAFDKKGEFVAQSFNAFREGITGKYGGLHAEAKLMKHYGTVIKTILIARVGHGGDFLPIDPCPKCRAMADKLGIRIVRLQDV